jgi:hypothetical protein
MSGLFYVGRIDGMRGRRFVAGVGVVSEDRDRLATEMGAIAAELISRHRCSVSLTILTCRYGHRPELLAGPFFYDETGRELEV